MTTDRLDELYEWLAAGPTPDCDEIFGAALEHAESPYIERIIGHLFGRQNDAAWATLIANYRRLPLEARQQLGANANLVRTGLALALGSPSASARCNALVALVEQPCPTLAYLLPDLLRDVSDDVRKAAVPALRRLAEVVADQVPAPNWDESRRREYALARTEVAKALQRALHTFDRPYRLEAVELSLWFVQELGDELWQRLSDRRSPCAHIVSNHLPEWNSPRLARFLLQALTHPPWRRLALQILQSWSRLEEVSALLSQSDLLADAELCRRLGALRQPGWLDQLAREGLRDLPVDGRPHAPVWVCHLGLSDAEKVEVLSGWLDTGDVDVQRACVSALAALATPPALARLAHAAEGSSPMAALARQCMRGESGAGADTRAAADAGQGGSPPAADPGTPSTRLSAIDEWTDLRSACTEKIRAEDAALIALVRNDLEASRPQVGAHLRSADPRERLLGLRVIAGAQCAGDFAAELQALLEDPVDAIRRLARTVLGAGPPTARESEPAPAPAATPRGAAPNPQTAGKPASAAPASFQSDPAEVRHELRRALARLLADESQSLSTAELVRQLRDLLRQVPGELCDAPQTEARRAEARE
jgi:hypothetical protein